MCVAQFANFSKGIIRATNLLSQFIRAKKLYSVAKINTGEQENNCSIYTSTGDFWRSVGHELSSLVACSVNFGRKLSCMQTSCCLSYIAYLTLYIASLNSTIINYLMLACDREDQTTYRSHHKVYY